MRYCLLVMFHINVSIGYYILVRPATCVFIEIGSQLTNLFMMVLVLWEMIFLVKKIKKIIIIKKKVQKFFHHYFRPIPLDSSLHPYHIHPYHFFDKIFLLRPPLFSSPILMAHTRSQDLEARFNTL
jgi:hypothetical protein